MTNPTMMLQADSIDHYDDEVPGFLNDMGGNNIG